MSEIVTARSRKEAALVMLVWLLASLWCVGYAALKGYGTNASPAPEMLLGMPSWVVWGVLAPWVVTLSVTLWFAGGGIHDEDLGLDQPDPAEWSE